MSKYLDMHSKTMIIGNFGGYKCLRVSPYVSISQTIVTLFFVCFSLRVYVLLLFFAFCFELTSGGPFGILIFLGKLQSAPLVFKIL